MANQNIWIDGEMLSLGETGFLCSRTSEGGACRYDDCVEQNPVADEDEEEISLDQVPAAVKATILAEAKGAPIKEVEREIKNGRTVYEAEWVVNGQEIEIKVAPDGTLLKREIEEEGDEEDDDDDDN